MNFDEYLRRLAYLESRNDPLAANPNSSARGLYQFMPDTAKQYGITAEFGTPEYTQQEQAAIMPFTQDNYNSLKGVLGREPTEAELYLAHQQGAGGASKILSNPNELAANLVGADAISLNAGNPEMTAQDFASLWTDKYNSAFMDNQPQEVTDPELLAQLEGGDTGPEEVTDPELLAMLEGGQEVQSPAYDRRNAGFIERMDAAGKRRFGQIQEIADQAGQGDIGDKEALLRIGLKTAQIVPDAAGEAFVSAFRALPDVIENPIREKASDVYTSLADSALGDLAGSAVQAYKSFEKEHPVAAGRLSSLGDVGNLVAGFIPIGSTGTNAIRATEKAALPALRGTAVAANAIRPTLNPQAQALKNLGVRLTPGQRAGGLVKSIEDKATSIPILGDTISAAQRRSIEDFNIGIANDTLSSIGAKVPKKMMPGRDMVSHVYDEIGKSYDDVLSKTTGVLDQQFDNDKIQAFQRFAELPKEKAKQVRSTIDSIIGTRNKSGNIIKGRDNKEIMRRLGDKAAGYSKSQDPDQQLMGSIFRDMHVAYSKMLQRNNPADISKKLKDTDLAFAKYVRLEKASGSTGAENGIFTPAQFSSAVKMSDNSVRRGQFSRGESLMQDLADAGKAVLPNKYPDSGTAGRALLALATAGGAGATALAAPWAIPLLGAGAFGTLAYTRPGQAALRNLSIYK